MGWTSECGTHEGYVVGLVFDDAGLFNGHAHYPDSVGIGPRSGRMRELGNGHDVASGVVLHSDAGPGDPFTAFAPKGRKIPLAYVKVACSCGWRSPLLHTHDAHWSPCIAITRPDFEEKAAQLWAYHNATSTRARTGGYSIDELLTGRR